MAHRNPSGDEWDHPPEPDPAFDSDCESWESRCDGPGNTTHRHGRTAHKLADRWQCGYCLRWLRLPKGRR